VQSFVYELPFARKHWLRSARATGFSVIGHQRHRHANERHPVALHSQRSGGARWLPGTTQTPIQVALPCAGRNRQRLLVRYVSVARWGCCNDIGEPCCSKLSASPNGVQATWHGTPQRTRFLQLRRAAFRRFSIREAWDWSSGGSVQRDQHAQFSNPKRTLRTLASVRSRC